MYNVKRRNKGITLVALIITIIVLLILAGVSFVSLLGENGIITRAMQAKSAYEEASLNEQKVLNMLADEIGLYTEGKTNLTVKDLINSDINSIRLALSSKSKDITISNMVIESQTGKYNTNIYGVGRIKYKGEDTNFSLDTKFKLRENYPLITTYWQNWKTEASSGVNMKLIDVPEEYDIVIVAFGIGDGTSRKCYI